MFDENAWEPTPTPTEPSPEPAPAPQANAGPPQGAQNVYEPPPAAGAPPAQWSNYEPEMFQSEISTGPMDQGPPGRMYGQSRMPPTWQHASLAPGMGMGGLSDDVIAQVEIEARYDGYIATERRRIDRDRELDDLALPAAMDYASLKVLSFEAREKLARIRPDSLGQAARIPGIRAVDMSILAALLRR